MFHEDRHGDLGRKHGFTFATCSSYVCKRAREALAELTDSLT